jgi:hypothetical protein
MKNSYEEDEGLYETIIDEDEDLRPLYPVSWEALVGEV